MKMFQKYLIHVREKVQEVNSIKELEKADLEININVKVNLSGEMKGKG